MFIMRDAIREPYIKAQCWDLVQVNAAYHDDDIDIIRDLFEEFWFIPLRNCFVLSNKSIGILIWNNIYIYVYRV